MNHSNDQFVVITRNSWIVARNAWAICLFFLAGFVFGWYAYVISFTIVTIANLIFLIRPTNHQGSSVVVSTIDAAKIDDLKKRVESIPMEISHELPFIQSGGIPKTSSERSIQLDGRSAMMNRRVSVGSLGWVAGIADSNQYLQVMFPFYREVTRIQIQGRGQWKENEWPTEYEIQRFTINGTWEIVHEGKTGIKHPENIHTILAKHFSMNQKQTPVIAGGIRIYIRQFVGHPSMRCEVWTKSMLSK